MLGLRLEHIMSFALDVLLDTLEAVRAQGDLLDIPEDADMDCDWEEADCPTCGRAQDNHNQRQMTRCAGAWF